MLACRPSFHQHPNTKKCLYSSLVSLWDTKAQMQTVSGSVASLLWKLHTRSARKRDWIENIHHLVHIVKKCIWSTIKNWVDCAYTKHCLCSSPVKVEQVAAKRKLLFKKKKCSGELSPWILPEARGKLRSQLEESSLFSKAKKKTSILCLAIAKHSTSSWTQRLHGDARRQQCRAVGCFSAAGPGRLVKTEGTWMQKNITKDNLT